MPSVTTPSQPRRLSTRLNLLARHVACIALALCPLGTAHAVERIVQAGTLIDGVGGAARQKVSIIIKDERIVAIEPGFVTHSGADIIDLKNATVLPGFIDCHVHIAGKLPSSQAPAMSAAVMTPLRCAAPLMRAKLPAPVCGYHSSP